MKNENTGMLGKASMTLRIFAIILAVTGITLSAWGRDYSPDEIVNPNLADRYEYVADPEGRLDMSTRRKVNRRLQALRDSTSAEVAVAVVPSIGDYTIEDFSEKVFTHWGLGKSDKDNGVLLLISPDSRQVRIQTGYGTEGVLPDITCSQIIQHAVIPNMKAGCLDCAVDEATEMITEIMTNPEYAEELRSAQPDFSGGSDSAPVSGEDVTWFLAIIICCVWIFTLADYILDCRKAKRLPTVQSRVWMWKNSLSTYLVLGFASLLTAMPFYLLARRNYRKTRYGSHRCPNCGGRTRVLSEQDENRHLTPSQQFEEKLGSMEYDVHKCDKCGQTETVALPSEKTPYSTCPSCGTRAYHLAGADILRQPSYHSEGTGVKHYVCEYCGHSDDRTYRIPKKDMSGAIAAATILSSAGHRRSGGGFGGGSFGGGFGGGSTGGGGASGSW